MQATASRSLNGMTVVTATVVEDAPSGRTGASSRMRTRGRARDRATSLPAIVPPTVAIASGVDYPSQQPPPPPNHQLDQNVLSAALVDFDAATQRTKPRARNPRANARANRANSVISLPHLPIMPPQNTSGLQPHTRYRMKLNSCMEQLHMLSCPSLHDATQYDILSNAIFKLQAFTLQMQDMDAELNRRRALKAAGLPITRAVRSRYAHRSSTPKLEQSAESSKTAVEGFSVKPMDVDAADVKPQPPGKLALACRCVRRRSSFVLFVYSALRKERWRAGGRGGGAGTACSFIHFPPR